MQKNSKVLTQFFICSGFGTAVLLFTIPILSPEKIGRMNLLNLQMMEVILILMTGISYIFYLCVHTKKIWWLIVTQGLILFLLLLTVKYEDDHWGHSFHMIAYILSCLLWLFHQLFLFLFNRKRVEKKIVLEYS